MTGYEKKIAYFDLVENGQRIGNAGFAKVIVQNGQVRLTTNISGLHKIDTLKTEILFTKGKIDIMIDTIYIKEGRCIYSRLFTEDELMSLDAEWEKVNSVCVKVGENRRLIAVINPNVQFVEVEEKCIEKQYIENQEFVMDSEEQIEHMLETAEHKEEQPKGAWLHDDKWKRLEDIFPHVHPFGDGREFLSIKPKDFVVLTKEYQCLANNSFLLHGFYNYHHIILGKIVDGAKGDSNTEKLYIGVPGVFYEREKAVALMFGFESFGCSKEPAEIGTFGYYMKRVEI